MNIALIVASGNGSRFGGDLPKQFVILKGKPLICHTLQKFVSNENVHRIILVVNRDYIDFVNDIINKYLFNKNIEIVEGGKTRQESVLNGLRYLNAKNDDIVLIHDGVRPLISKETIDLNIEQCEKYSAVETVKKATDTTFISSDEKTLTKRLNRSEVFQAETPQTFKYALILNAHENAIKDGYLSATDDAEIASKYGSEVHLILNSTLNFKVTTKEDLKIVESLL